VAKTKTARKPTTMPKIAREANRLSIARSKSSEHHAVLCDLEAQIAGALSLIGIEYRADDPNGDLLHAAMLLQKALEIGEDLRNLILQPESLRVRIEPDGCHHG
jgi:hypothetical protein